MTPAEDKVGSLPSIRRLPTYLRVLKQIEESGRDIVSSSFVASLLKLDAIQVRKDLAITGAAGKPKVGYYVPALIQSIEEFLGWDNSKEAFLVGAGNLGSALLGYEGFKQHGLDIVAAFDVDQAKIGTEIYGKSVLSIEKLPSLAERMHVTTGIIAVPAEAAQAAANMMFSGGINAVWNFAPVTLDAPVGVVIQNEDLAAGLAVLCVKAAALRDGKRVKQEVL